LEEIRAVNHGNLNIKLDALLKLEVEMTMKRAEKLEAQRLRLSVHTGLALRNSNFEPRCHVKREEIRH
jgi:hypothetical protein